ncbi:hypothetical protein ADMFC3_12520 [Geovibrio sp. ADMFC3]
MDFIVKIKVIPNVFEKRNRIEKEVQYEPVSVFDLFSEHCTDFTAGDFYPVINGKRVEWERRVNPRDEVIFINDIQGDGNLFNIVLGTAAIAAGFLSGGASWAVYAYAFGGSMLATGAIGALGLFTPSIPGNTLRNDYEDSRTYNWGGIENIVGEGNVVPVVYGRHRVGGVIISGFIDGDAESGKQTGQYLNYLIGLSEGEIGGIGEETVKVNDTFLSDFADASYVESVEKNIILSAEQQEIFNANNDFAVYSVDKINVSVFVPDKLFRQEIIINDEGKPVVSSSSFKLTLYFTFGSSTKKVVLCSGDGDKSNRNFKVSIDLPFADTGWVVNCRAELRKDGDLVSLGGEKIVRVSYTRKGGIYYLASRLGSADQTPIKGFSDIRRDTAISGKKITYNNSQSFTTVDVCDSAVVSVAFPALYNLDDKGNLKNKSVKFIIEYRLYDESENWVTAVDPEDGDTEFICTAATRAEVIFSYRLNFNSTARRVIRVTRLTADVSDGDTKNAADSYFSRVVEIQSVDVAYDNTALLALRVRATDSISGSTPSVTTVISGRLIKDVRDLDAESFSSSNPANILYDLLTNTRYGAGRFLDADQIDLESFQEFADFCDEQVYYTDDNGDLVYQKRFEMNLVIDKEFRLTEMIQKILGSCRATGIWSGDKLRIVIDRPAEVSQIFSMGNIIEDSYSESYADFGSIPNQLEAQYLDESSDYEQQMVSVFDADRIAEPVNSTTIQLYGFTDKAQVKREIAFALRKAKSKKKALEFSAGLDAVVAEIGDIIEFQHDTPQYGYGGRVKAVDGNLLTLDVPVSVAAGEQVVFKVRRADGEILKVAYSAMTSIEISSISIVHNDTVNKGDVWIMGVGEAKNKPYRLIGIEKEEGLSLKLTLEEYNESIYTDDFTSLINSERYSKVQVQKKYELGAVGDVAEIGEIVVGSQPVNITPPLVTDITIAEDFAVYTPKNPLSGVIVSFRQVEISGNPSVYVKEYELLYSEDAENWRSAGVTKSSRFELGGLLVGRTYYFVIRSRTNYGVVNAPESLYPHRTLYSITLGGEQNTFAAVQNLAAVRTPEGIRLSWRVGVSADVAHYRIDRARATAPIQPPVLLVEQFNGTVFTDSSALTAGRYNYTVIPTDPWGNDGEAAGVSVLITAPSAPADLAAVGDLFAVKLSWAAVADADYYEIWRADTEDGTKHLVGASVNNAYIDSGLGALDDYYYFVRTHDIYGFFSSFSSGVHGSTDADPGKLFDALAGDANPDDVRAGFADVVNLPEIKNKITGVLALEENIVEPGVVEEFSDIPPLHPRINEALLKLTEQGSTLIAQGTAILQNAEQIALRVAQTEYDGDMNVIADALTDITAEIGQIQTTVYDSETGLVSRMQQTESQFMLAVVDAATGKAISGLKVLGDPAQDVSEIALMADKVKFVSPAEGNDKFALFNMSDGVLVLNMDLVANGSITADKYLEVSDGVIWSSYIKSEYITGLDYVRLPSLFLPNEADKIEKVTFLWSRPIVLAGKDFYLEIRQDKPFGLVHEVLRVNENGIFIQGQEILPTPAPAGMTDLGLVELDLELFPDNFWDAELYEVIIFCNPLSDNGAQIFSDITIAFKINYIRTA